MLKWVTDKSNRVSGPLTVADWVARLWPYIASAGAGVVAWLSTTWDWYWQTFNWAGVAIAFLVAIATLSLCFFLVGLAAYLFRVPGRTLSLASTEPPTEDASLPEWLPSVPERLDKLSENINEVAQLIGSSDDRTNEIINSLAMHLDAIEAKIEAAKGNTTSVCDDLGRSIDQLRGMIESNRRQLQTHYHILVTSLRARDARVIFEEADDKVLSLGSQLLYANPEVIPDDKKWSEYYTAWRRNLERIDSLMAGWMPNRQPFLDIRAHELKSGGPPLPSHIVAKSDANIVPFKLVWLIYPRYTNERGGILDFFVAKASDLPG